MKQRSLLLGVMQKTGGQELRWEDLSRRCKTEFTVGFLA
jgi:hypothetical protein